MPVRGRNQAHALESGSADRFSRSMEKDNNHSYFGGELATCLAALNSLPIRPPAPPELNARPRTEAAGSGVSSPDKAMPHKPGDGRFGMIARWRAAGGDSGWRGVIGSEQGTSGLARAYGSAERANPVEEQTLNSGNGLRDRSSGFAGVAVVSGAEVTHSSDAAAYEQVSSQEPAVNHQSIAAASREQDQNLQQDVYQTTGAVADKYPSVRMAWDIVDRPLAGPGPVVSRVSGGSGLNSRPTERTQADSDGDAVTASGPAATTGSPSSASRAEVQLPTPAALKLHPSVKAQDYRAQVSRTSDAAAWEEASLHEPTVNHEPMGAASGAQDQNLQPNVRESVGAVADKYRPVRTTSDTVNRPSAGPESVAARPSGGSSGLNARPTERTQADSDDYAVAGSGSAATAGSPSSASKPGTQQPTPAALKLYPSIEGQDYRAQVSQNSDAAAYEEASSQELTVNHQSIGAASGEHGQNLRQDVYQTTGAVVDKYPSVRMAWDRVDRPLAGPGPVISRVSGGSGLNGRPTERTQADSDGDAVTASGPAATTGSPSSASKPEAPLPTPTALELHPSVEAQGYRSKGAQEKQPEQTVTGMALNTADEPARYAPLQWPATKSDNEPTERARPTLQNNLESTADASNRRFGNSLMEKVLPDGSGRVSNAETNQAAGHFHATAAALETGSYSLMGRPPAGPDHPALENAATLKVELELGGSVRANIRERSGTVEVRMMTGDSQAARGLTGEAGGLRNALGNSGLKLQSLEVSYQNDQRQRRPSQQLAADLRSRQGSGDDAEVFSIPGSNQ